MKSLLYGLLAATLLFWGCGTNDTAKQPQTPAIEQASLRFSWFATASFSGEVVGMTKFAKQNNLDLKCEVGGPGVNPITLVQTGQNTFGTHSADEILSAIDKGADLVIIGVVNYDSPGGFVSLAEKNIRTPKDLEGKTVGMLPFGSTTLLFESLVRANHLDRSKIKDLTVSPDMKPFLDGQYDVHPVFVYDETVTLDGQGIKYNLIEPKNYGVSYRGQCYFCKRETLEKNPELVTAFVRSMAEGWNYALAHQAEAIDMLKAFAPDVDKDREVKVLAKGADYFRGYQGHPLDCDGAAWTSMIDELLTAGVIKNRPDIKRVIYMDAVRAYYH